MLCSLKEYSVQVCEFKYTVSTRFNTVLRWPSPWGLLWPRPHVKNVTDPWECKKLEGEQVNCHFLEKLKTMNHSVQSFALPADHGILIFGSLRKPLPQPQYKSYIWGKSQTCGPTPNFIIWDCYRDYVEKQGVPEKCVLEIFSILGLNCSVNHKSNCSGK